MLTVFPCYAKEDREVAEALSAFLEQGAGVQIFLEDGEIGAGETLVSKAADGLAAAVILLILSPDSTPARWVRRDWEPVLLDQPRSEGVKVATILARTCDFPGLLRREAFFDLSQDRLSAFREIKRWLLGLDPGRRAMEFEAARQRGVDEAEVERLRQTLADKPGRAVVRKTDAAIEFARQSRRDFEGLVWLSCAGQSMAALAGEMSSQLGMALDGDVEDNLRELGKFCAQRRLLIVLDQASENAERLVQSGRSSTLLIPPEAEASAEDLANLGSERRKLWVAACACGNVPFRLALAAEIAGLDFGLAAGFMEDLVERGLVIQLDVRYLVKGAVREMTLAGAHAQVVCRLFASWATEGSACETELAQLRRALDWALAQADNSRRQLACDLAKRGIALMKRKRRQAEALETLEAIVRDAERREDRRMIEDFSREQVWILESWGRTDEAQRIFHKRRALYEDQMQFNFDFPEPTPPNLRLENA